MIAIAGNKNEGRTAASYQALEFEFETHFVQ